MFKPNQILLCNKPQNSSLRGERMVHFVSATAGALQDAFVRTPVSAGLDFVTGPAAKMRYMAQSAGHRAIVQQANWDSFLVLPFIGRIRGAVMNILGQASDSKASPALHPFTNTIPNISNNLNNSLQRVLNSIVHGDEGPKMDAFADSRKAIEDAKASYEAVKQPDQRDSSLAAYVPILGTVHAILGGAKELVLDTQLDGIISLLEGLFGKSGGILKETFSKMFLSEGKKLSVLQRIGKVPTGLLSGVANFFLSKDKSPLWHVVTETAPRYLKNTVLSIARGVVGFFLGDPGEQVNIGQSTVKAKSLAHRTFTTTSSWLTRIGGWLGGAGAGAGVAGATSAAAGLAGAATTAGIATAANSNTMAGAANALAANTNSVPGAAQAAAA